MLFASAAAFAGLLGCSNTRIEPPRTVLQVRPLESIPSPHDYHDPPTDAERLAWQFEAFAQPRSPTPGQGEDFTGRICRVGGPSCLEIDDRPFEPCLLSSQDCGEKILESRRRGENIGPPRLGPDR
jgi:hypothetical protein